jgi:hypothetical protein
MADNVSLLPPVNLLDFFVIAVTHPSVVFFQKKVMCAVNQLHCINMNSLGIACQQFYGIFGLTDYFRFLCIKKIRLCCNFKAGSCNLFGRKIKEHLCMWKSE